MTLLFHCYSRSRQGHAQALEQPAVGSEDKAAAFRAADERLLIEERGEESGGNRPCHVRTSLGPIQALPQSRPTRSLVGRQRRTDAGKGLASSRCQFER